MNQNEELERLRRWKHEATYVLEQWHASYELLKAAGHEAPLGASTPMFVAEFVRRKLAEEAARPDQTDRSEDVAQCGSMWTPDGETSVQCALEAGHPGAHTNQPLDSEGLPAWGSCIWQPR